MESAIPHFLFPEAVDGKSFGLLSFDGKFRDWTGYFSPLWSRGILRTYLCAVRCSGAIVDEVATEKF